MNDKEKILAAKKKLQEGWTKHAVARNALGEHCPEFSEEAVCWCLLGAFGFSMPPVVYMLTGWQPALWNDQPYRTKDEVLSLLDKALEMCDE